MRDEEWFSDAVRWTQEQSDLADALVQHWRTRRDTAAEDVVGECCATCIGSDEASVNQVWR